MSSELSYFSVNTHLAVSAVVGSCSWLSYREPAAACDSLNVQVGRYKLKKKKKSLFTLTEEFVLLRRHTTGTWTHMSQP